MNSRKAIITSIFISHSQADVACAEGLRQGLAAKGYDLWREPEYPGSADSSYPRMIENAILGSAAVVLVWSGKAIGVQEIERQIAFARQLKKPLLVVVLDSTALPATLTGVVSVQDKAPCSDAAAQLLPHLPAVDSTDALIQLWQQAAHEYNIVRKEAIDLAAAMLKRGEHRDEVLAVLQYLAQHDLMAGVKDKAQEVLDANTKQNVPPSFWPNEAKHIIQVPCQKCGHVSYFDKRVVCPLKKDGWRGTRTQGNKKLDVLKLACKTCGTEAYVDVDCEGYR